MSNIYIKMLTEGVGAAKAQFKAFNDEAAKQNMSLLKLNNSYQRASYWQENLRDRTLGLRREVSKLRNDLLLLSFSFGLVKTTLFDSINDAEKWKNSFLGLSSVARNTGNTITGVKEAAIQLTQDGLLTLSEASAGLKNLLATQFELPQAIEIMKTFKDSAAFNRQGTLQFGEAIVRATEGIKNQISALVDNVGITKNLSVILKEYGFRMEDIQDNLKGTAARQALLNGLMKEARFFYGDAASLASTYSGSLSRLNTEIFKTKASFGSILTEGVGASSVLTEFNKKSLESVTDIREWIEVNKSFIATKFEETYNNLARIFTTIATVLAPVVSVFAKFADIIVNTPFGNLLAFWVMTTKIFRSLDPITNAILGKFKSLFAVFQSSTITGKLTATFNEMHQSLKEIGLTDSLNKLKEKFFTLGNDIKIQENQVKRWSDLWKSSANSVGAVNLQLQNLPTTLGKQLKYQQDVMAKLSSKKISLTDPAHIAKVNASLASFNKALGTTNLQIGQINNAVKLNDFFSGRITPDIKSIKEIQNALLQLKNAGLLTEKQFNSFQKAIDLSSKVVNSKKAVQDLALVQDFYNKKLKITPENIKLVDRALKDLKDSGTLTNKELKLFEQIMNPLRTQARALSIETKAVSRSTEIWTASLKAGKAAMTALGGVMQNFVINLAKMIRVFVIFKIAETILSWISTTEDLAEKTNALIEKLSNLKSQLDENKQAYEQAYKTTREFGLETVKTVLSIGNAEDKFGKYNTIIQEASKINETFGESIKKAIAEFANTNSIDTFIESINKAQKAQLQFQIDTNTLTLGQYRSELDALIERMKKVASGVDTDKLESTATRQAEHMLKIYKKEYDSLIKKGQGGTQAAQDALKKMNEQQEKYNKAFAELMSRVEEPTIDVSELIEAYDRAINAEHDYQMLLGKREISDSLKLPVNIKDTEALEESKKWFDRSKANFEEMLAKVESSKSIMNAITSALGLSNDKGEEAVKVLRSMIEKYGELSKAMLNAKGSISQAQEALDKFNLKDEVKDLWLGGTMTEAAKNLDKNLESFQQVIDKLGSIDASKNVEVSVIDPKKIQSTFNFTRANVETFLDDLKSKMGNLDASTPLQFFNTRTKQFLAMTLEEVEKFTTVTNKTLEGAFAFPIVQLKGDAADIKKQLNSMYHDLTEEEKLKLNLKAVIQVDTKSATQGESELERFREQLEQQFAKTKIPVSPMFEQVNEQIAGFNARLIEILKDMPKLDPVQSDILQRVQELIFGIGQIAKYDLAKKFTKDSEISSKAMEKEAKTIELVANGYRTLEGKTISYYTQMTDQALKFADIENAYVKKKEEINEKLAEAQKEYGVQDQTYAQAVVMGNESMKESPARALKQKLDLIKALEKEGIAVDELHKKQVKLLESQLLTGAQDERYAARLEAVKGKPSIVTDIFGVNFEQADAELDKFHNESKLKQVEFNKALLDLQERHLITETDRIKWSEDFKLDLEQQAQNKRFEFAKQFFQKSAEIAQDFFELTENQAKKEIYFIRARAEAEQQILKDQYKTRYISKAEYEKQASILEKKRVIEERATNQRRQIELEQQIRSRLKAQAIEWGILAIASAAARDYQAAAQYGMAAALAGGAATAFAANADKKLAELEKWQTIQTSRAENFRGYGRSNYASESPSGGTIGGTINAQELKITLAPSVNIDGDTILIGNIRVQELQFTLGQAIVKSTQDAIQSGEINVKALTNKGY